MPKFATLTILAVLLASFVSAQAITGNIGLNVVTNAQSVDATTSLNVKNETPVKEPKGLEIAINRTPENLTPITLEKIEALPAKPTVPETVFTLISRFFRWFRLS